ncbi:16S rRNA (cytosine(967)-C(5))-methyltransferase RsmB [Sporolactobacillus sp. THM7-4]|nr:16S rRNA (cytosine(967)-C(5))-methyltransferase RsmB [Sporolactobacillus sp. THM7-4]
MSSHTVRETALDLLLSIKKNHAYSQLALNDALLKSHLHDRDKALVTTLVYGVLQRELTLEYALSSFVRKTRKLDDWVRILLLMSLYQKMYLDRIPDHAIVNEATNIAKKRGHRGIAGFVNGVLRQFLRSGEPDLSVIQPENRRLSVQYSHPEWLLELWENQWGRRIALQIAEADNRAPHLYVRVNRLKTTRQALAEKLALEGIATEEARLSPDCLTIQGGQAAATEAYRAGLLTIQDQSSMLVADSVAPAPGMTILDTCAGPGGKTTHLGERMGNKGKIVALDLHEHKTRLIDDAARRLGIRIIETRAIDARKANEVYPEKTFDRVLVDAPCSGLGVIRRKPEIKWEKTKEDADRLTPIQYAILEAAAPLVKPGGWLIYSTCTINRMENDRLLTRFLNDHREFMWEPTFFSRLPRKLKDYRSSPQSSMVQILPFYFETDGFFIGCLKKKET